MFRLIPFSGTRQRPTMVSPHKGHSHCRLTFEDFFNVPTSTFSPATLRLSIMTPQELK